VAPSGMDGAVNANADLEREFAGVVGDAWVAGAGEGCAYAIDGVAPRLVVTPGSPEELAEVLKLSAAAGLRVLPRGGGTKLALGNPPEAGEVCVSTVRLDKVIVYRPADMTVSVQAGVRLQSLQRTLAEKGQFLALDPPRADLATIGGVLAANSSGPLRAGYGTARDVLIGIRVAHADGVLTKAGGMVVKNVTGYDMDKLYVGSLGTLGVIVEANFKLNPLPAVEKTVAGRFGDARGAESAVDALVYSVLSPNSVEMLNEGATRSVDMGGGATVSRMLLVKFGARAEAVERQIRDAAGMIEEAGGEVAGVLEGADQLRVWNALRNLPHTLAKDAVICKISSLSSSFGPVLRTVEDCAREEGLQAPAWGRAINGVAYAALTGAPAAPEKLRGAIESLRMRLGRLKATLVIESCPTEVKRGLDVWDGDLDANALDVMRSIKAKFDPGRVLNPGRFVGGI